MHSDSKYPKNVQKLENIKFKFLKPGLIISLWQMLHSDTKS